MSIYVLVNNQSSNIANNDVIMDDMQSSRQKNHNNVQQDEFSTTISANEESSVIIQPQSSSIPLIDRERSMSLEGASVAAGRGMLPSNSTTPRGTIEMYNIVSYIRFLVVPNYCLSNYTFKTTDLLFVFQQ